MLSITVKDKTEVPAALAQGGHPQNSRYIAQIHPSVTIIVEGAFQGCAGLVGVVIPPSVAHIHDHAFESTGLVSVDIPQGITYIGACAFRFCAGLVSVVIPPSVTEIGECTFTGCTGLVSVVIPPSVTEIGDYAFWNCTSLISVDIPSSIRDGAFFGCTSLISVDISSSVKHIGDYAFFGCTGLVGVVIRPSVTKIGTNAFHDCERLVVAICDRQDVFEGCTRLQRVLPWSAPKKDWKYLSLFNWSVGTHHPCSPARQKWVEHVMLCAQRLSTVESELALPVELWWAILEQVPRRALGPAA
jgi:hypothetical protein